MTLAQLARAIAAAAESLATEGVRARVVTAENTPARPPAVSLWRAIEAPFVALALATMRTETYRLGVTVATADEGLYLAGLPALAAFADGAGDLRFWRLTIAPRGEVTRQDAGPARPDPAQIIAALRPLLAGPAAPAPVRPMSLAPFVSLAPLPFAPALRQPAAREQGDHHRP